MKRILISLIIGIVIGAVGMAILGTQVSNLFSSNPEITTSYISGIIEEGNDLNSAELQYSGLVTYEEGKIPFIDKKGFGMKYNATVRAGIDVKKIDIDVSDADKTVTVELPEPEIQSLEIDPDSIEFFDQKFALFKGDEKEDVTKAVSEARKDAEKKTVTSDLLNKAADNAKKTIYGLLEPAIGDYELVVISR